MKKCVLSCAAGLLSRYSHLLTAFCVVVGMSPILAEDSSIQTVYLSESSDYKQGNGFAGAIWKYADGKLVGDDGKIAPDYQPNYDFVISNKRYVDPRTGETIKAHKIIIGDGGSYGTLRCRLQPIYECTEGIVLANGMIRTTTTNHRTIQGKITVTAPSSSPFLFDTTGSSGGGITFSGVFCGAEGTGFRFNSGVSNCYYEFSDASQYCGDIEVTSTNGSGMAAGDARLVMTTLSARNVSLAKNCILELTSSAHASVANLVMHDGSAMKFKLPATPNLEPFLTVGESIACEGEVLLSFDASALLEPTEYPIVKIPAGNAESVAFRLKDGVPYTWPVLSRTVDAETGDTIIRALFYPQIKTAEGATGDGSSTDMSLDADASSSMTNAATWADGNAVHSGAHYNFNIQHKNIRTPWHPEGSYEFPGESLTLGAKNTTFILACRDVWCPVFYAGNYENLKLYCAEASDVTFHGDIYTTYQDSENIEANFRIRIYNNHCFTLDGELKGSGNVLLKAGTSASSFKGSQRGDFLLARKSEGFTGKITLTSDAAAGDRKWSEKEPYAHVWYADPACFGGARDAFAYDALKIEKMARLITTNNVVFSDLTRGLFLSGIAQLETPEATDSLTLLQPVTVNGRVYKQGAGTLAMGGELKFIDAENARTDTPPDDAAKRTLYVQGGVLKPLAADALNGLDIVFSNSVNVVAGVNVADVALELDLDTEDAELKAYGLRNTKSSSPLTLSLAGGATKVPVRLISARTSADEAFSVGVMTVKSEIANETFAKLDIRKPEGLASIHMSRKVETDAAAGTSTLVVTFKHTGFGVVVR